MTARHSIAALAVSGLLLLGAGCATTPAVSVEPGDGPAPSTSATSTYDVCDDVKLSDNYKAEQGCDGFALDGPTEEETATLGGEEETESTAPDEGEEAEPEVATFKEKYEYPDGVEVEVIKVKHLKISRADAENSEPEASAGDPVVILTVRVKNGSKKKMDAYSMFDMTVGADGDAAVQPYLASSNDKETQIAGAILPGRSKVATESFVISLKDQKDPVLEFSFDSEHEPAIFSGSLK